ncbi:sugar transporter [Alphaproteobacteria bacterium KMM 3653]|uniref:Sugar transporter n=1 Tax=Harenicola maris TaxID=2841044 RepID=A0AAP2CU91_9RHOB|nr:sugar transporter [Harenicola maris]
MAPIAPRAGMRRRHWGLLASFLLLVAAPLVVTAFYLWVVAEDQYASTVGFTVRQEESAGSVDILGGLTSQITGISTQTDTDILYEFMQSQELVTRINAKHDLVATYSAHWDEDRVFALSPDATVEDLVSYWSRIVQTSYDQSTGLMEVRVLAFEPEDAQAIAQSILDESQSLINELNSASRDDAMRYAQEDLDASLARLKTARAAMTQFRTRTRIVDPETDLQGRMGVLNTLQGQLAEALIELDLLEGSTSETDPRVVQAKRRIRVIRDRIAEERDNFASDDASTGGEDYPALMAEYEGLVVDREFAEQTYTGALAQLEVAKANANRQSRYLAAYVQPTFPYNAEYPRRGVLFGLTALFLLLAWSILALVYYSVRDSR